MKLIYVLNPINEVHLERVMRDMVDLDEGPVLRCIDLRGYYVALEGSHRLEAARRLGYPVVPLPVDRHRTIHRGDVAGLFMTRKKMRAKDLALGIVNKRFRMLTPIYKWDEETGLLELKHYPVLDRTTLAKVIFYTSVTWIGLFAVLLIFLTPHLT